MMQLLFLVISAVSSTAIASPCSKYVGSCEYYACLDQEVLSCGDLGYALGYGKKYCERFTALQFAPHRTALEEEAFPAVGAVWRDRVKVCLMNELEHYVGNQDALSCGELRSFAFKSHPHCYTRSPSFCELSLENATRVGLTIEPRTLIAQESIDQIRDTATICVRDLSERITKASSFAVRLQLQHARGLWRLVARRPETLRQLDSMSINSSDLN
jgi:hypothetical protein